MSSSPTPQRRRRDESEEDESGQINLVDAANSQARKRQRLSNDTEDSGSEDDESEEDPLLPNSYRRSPKGKGRARDAPPSGPLQHKPGSIVRITMKTFVTYSYAEFFPSAGLNMVIGPNGTGKSTVVCGICLGLGWPPSNLGRAKEITEFIKHGSKDATIEIELKADPERHSRNPIIKCVIAKDGGRGDDGKATFFVDGRKSTRKAVQELAKSFSIQVDNLCQFLPQDRVVEFAGLSPVELLTHTQRAAAPEYMSEWHETLKTIRREEKLKHDANQKLIENLKELEDKQKNEAALVERMQQHTAQKKEVESLEKLRPFADFVLLRRRHLEAKERKKDAAREYRQLETRAAPNLQAMNEKEEYFRRLDKLVGSKKRLLESTERMLVGRTAALHENEEAVKECEKEKKAEIESGKSNKQTISRCSNEIRNIEQQLANPPEPFDPAVFNEQTRELSAKINERSTEADGTSDEINSLRERARHRQEKIKEEEEKRTHMQSQAGRLSSKLEAASSHTARAWQWVQDNRDKFTSDVYGPPMIECHVADSKHAGWLESALGRSELLAITATSRADFQLLSHQIITVMKLHDVNLRSCTHTLDSFRAPMSKEDLRQFGLEGWLMELIEGPDTILAMLCDNRNLHATAYTNRESSTEQYEAIKRSSVGSWVTPINLYQITRRRDYADAGFSAKVSQVKKAQLLTDAPIDTQADEASGRQIAEWQHEIEEIKSEIAGVKGRDSSLKAEIKRLEEEREALRAEKNRKQRMQTQFEGLQAKLEGIRNKQASARTQFAERRTRLDAIDEKAENLALKKGQLSIDYGKVNVTLHGLLKELLDFEIMRIESQSDYEQLKHQNEEETRLLQERKSELERLEKSAEELSREGHRLGAHIRNELVPSLNEREREMQENIADLDPEQLATKIDLERNKLVMLEGNHGNANTIARFEERAAKIIQKRALLTTVETELDALIEKMNDIRSRWEPQLEELVRQISEAFADNFSRIQCAGEVGVYKEDRDFDKWEIQIKVKFREEAPLNILDAQRQSGGERAVSTSFYLMALQSLARAPFRVVDEINQGMDPRNERQVHSRMVEIACEEHTSQYFLITPKLLNGLKYHPNMKVHCIASGEYMPDKNAQLGTFEDMAMKALAIRTAAGA